MTQPERNVQINISGIPVAGVGGLGLVAMAVVVSVFMPAARWTMISGVIGGILLAVVLVFVRRRLDKREPGAPSPSVLFVGVSEPCPTGERSEQTARHGAKRLIPARQGA